MGTESLRNLRQLLEPVTVKSNSPVGVWGTVAGLINEVAATATVAHAITSEAIMRPRVCFFVVLFSLIFLSR